MWDASEVNVSRVRMQIYFGFENQVLSLPATSFFLCPVGELDLVRTPGLDKKKGRNYLGFFVEMAKEKRLSSSDYEK